MIVICSESFDRAFKEGDLFIIGENAEFKNTRYLDRLSDNQHMGVVYMPDLGYYSSSVPKHNGDLLAKFEPACRAFDIILGV